MSDEFPSTSRRGRDCFSRERRAGLVDSSGIGAGAGPSDEDLDRDRRRGLDSLSGDDFFSVVVSSDMLKGLRMDYILYPFVNLAVKFREAVCIV